MEIEPREKWTAWQYNAGQHDLFMSVMAGIGLNAAYDSMYSRVIVNEPSGRMWKVYDSDYIVIAGECGVKSVMCDQLFDAEYRVIGP